VKKVHSPQSTVRSPTANQRIAKLYRDIMRCYAIRWRIIGLDPVEHERAAGQLERARYCRLQAQIFADYPL
jgi:hypothetical protein